MNKLLSVIVTVTALAYTGVPVFNNPQSLNSIGVKSFGGKYYSPLYYDWDTDGDRDLIIGYFADASGSGKVRYLQNTGTDLSPQFTDKGDMSAGGAVITVGGVWCSGANNPQVGDLNGDGINDLIIGEYGPNVYLFKRNADGTLAAGIALEDATGNKKLNEARFSAPVITDWNNDGLLDLVLGISNRGYTPEGYDSSGVIKLYINEGTKQAYKFVYKGLLTTGTGVLIRDDYMRLQSGDLNNDGKSDLVASNGYRTPPYCFNYYENTGTIESPKLASALMLKKTNGQLIDAEYYIFFCLTDWNKDGITDIIYQGNPASDDMYLCIGTMANQTLPSQNSANWGKQNIKLSSDGNRIILTAGKYPFLKKVTILTVTGRIIMVIPEVTSTAYVSIPVSLSRGVYVVRGQSATQTMESWIIITQ